MKPRERTIQREKAHHFQTYGRQPLVLERGEGCRVWDVDGTEYLDALGGIAVNVLGHCHPHVTRALREQAGKLLHVSNLYYTPVQSALVERLSTMSGFDRVFLANSGAEAVEGAIKLARRHAHDHGRTPDILGLEDCFHGRTLATLALGAEKYQHGFGPMPGGFHRIPKDDIAALEAAIARRPAALLLEPIQGEGGIHELDPAFLRAARARCDEAGVLLIFDEIQCGNGRTGTLYAWQGLDVRPDVLVTAKGLGGGVAIGAILADTPIAATLGPGDHGTTFGGNPLACAGSLATLEVLDRDDLPARAARLGSLARERLQGLAEAGAGIVEVRGRGLMLGAELEPDRDGPAVVDRMRELGVLANCTAGSVVRLLPPLILKEEELMRILDVLAQSLEEVGHHG